MRAGSVPLAWGAGLVLACALLLERFPPMTRTWQLVTIGLIASMAAHWAIAISQPDMGLAALLMAVIPVRPVLPPAAQPTAAISLWYSRGRCLPDKGLCAATVLPRALRVRSDAARVPGETPATACRTEILRPTKVMAAPGGLGGRGSPGPCGCGRAVDRRALDQTGHVYDQRGGGHEPQFRRSGRHAAHRAREPSRSADAPLGRDQRPETPGIPAESGLLVTPGLSGETDPSVESGWKQSVGRLVDMVRGYDLFCFAIALVAVMPIVALGLRGSPCECSTRSGS